MATDSAGGPVVDPTQNVLDLVNAESRRQDDLRQLEFVSIRRELTNFKDYQKIITGAETERINAIRAVDVAAVAVANTAAENRATTLAGQVNAAKDAQIVALKAETDPIRKDIGDLRQSQWTIAGGHEQVAEKRATSSGWAVWAGVAVAVFTLLSTGILSIVAIAITVYGLAK